MPLAAALLLLTSIWSGQVHGDGRGCRWRWSSSWICSAVPFRCDGLQVPSQVSLNRQSGHDDTNTPNATEDSKDSLLPRPIRQTAERPKETLKVGLNTGTTPVVSKLNRLAASCLRFCAFQPRRLALRAAQQLCTCIQAAIEQSKPGQAACCAVHHALQDLHVHFDMCGDMCKLAVSNTVCRSLT